ncbi:tyrosine-type recombinase/integrase [Amycolatopsis sp. NPDC021455]|uniref:tyrosine-type recombinase/integrase n=1 Tax=Amycolatopsis sp. NPDC021455 TaxID=3154901 RepID=UPI0034021B1B
MISFGRPVTVTDGTPRVRKREAAHAMTTKTRRKSAPKNEEAAPEQLSSGRWRIYYWHPVKKEKLWVKNPEPGSRGTWPDESSALLAREEYKARLDGALIAQGIPVQRQTHKPDVKTFRQVVEEWLPLQDGTAQSCRSRRSYLNVLMRRFGDTPMPELKWDTYREWDLKEKDAGRAPATRANRLLYLGQVFRWAVKKGYCPKDETEGQSVKVRRLIHPEVIGPDTFDKVCQHAPDWTVVAFVLAYDCGLRAGEICGLTWRRFDLNSPIPTVLVRDVMEPGGTRRASTKTGVERLVSLTPRAVAMLKALRGTRLGDDGTDHVVRNSRNKPIDPSYISRQWRNAWRRSGVREPRPRFHDLRHCAATRLAATGAPIKVVQKMLGHTNLSTTTKYVTDAEVEEMSAWMNVVGQGRFAVVDNMPTPIDKKPAA